MKLSEIQQQGYILALFIRDDGERFLLGSGAYQFKEKQLHFVANKIESDTFEVQGSDGILLAGQVRRAAVQSFDGYVGDGGITREDVEKYRRAFLSFFRKNYYYKVVYVFNDGSAIQRERGFLVDAPEVMELYQITPEYHVALNFEDVNYYTYAEDASGTEIYGQVADIRVATGAKSGGLIWDSVGTVWDRVGAVWEEESGGGAVKLNINAIDNVYPVWEVTGPTVNPQLTIVETGTTIKYEGSVTRGQTLVIDMTNQTATISGLSVIQNVSGDWITMKPGVNRAIYTVDNPVDAPASKLRWQEIVG